MATLCSSLQEVTRKQSGVCSVQYLLEHVGEVHSDLQGGSATQQAAAQYCTMGFQLHSGVIQVFSFHPILHKNGGHFMVYWNLLF